MKTRWMLCALLAFGLILPGVVKAQDALVVYSSVDEENAKKLLYEIDWDGTTLLAVIGSPLEHDFLPEGSRVAFDFPANTAHILPQ